jgi:hypothetical protein
MDQTTGFDSKRATRRIGGGKRVPDAWDDDVDGIDERIELLSRSTPRQGGGSLRAAVLHRPWPAGRG